MWKRQLSAELSINTNSWSIHCVDGINNEIILNENKWNIKHIRIENIVMMCKVGLLLHNRYIDNMFYYFEVICHELNVNVITGSCESIFGTKGQVQVHPKKLFLLIFFNV